MPRPPTYNARTMLPAFERIYGVDFSGGVYTVGTFTSVLTHIGGNHASTSGDNVGP
jgi:hypothetical protein